MRVNGWLRLFSFPSTRRRNTPYRDLNLRKSYLTWAVMIHHTCKTLLHTYSVIPLILTAFLRRNWKCIIRRVHCTCSSWRFEAILPAAGCTRYCCRFLHGFYTHCRSVQPCYPSLSTYVFFTVVSWCVTFVAKFWSTISSIWLAFGCSCDSNSPPTAVKEWCTNKLVSLLCIVLLQN